MWPKYPTEQSGPLSANEPIWGGLAPGCSGDLHRPSQAHRYDPNYDQRRRYSGEYFATTTPTNGARVRLAFRGDS